MYKEPYVHQIFIGQPETFIESGDADHHFGQDTFETHVYKKSHEQSLWLSETGLDGDAPHPEDKALYAYAIRHYKTIETLTDQELSYGALGENLAVLEMDEYSVCVGDIYQFGDAIIQISQPHLPHWEVSYRFQFPTLAFEMQEQGMTGWYFRVLEPGHVWPHLDLVLIDRPHPLWTIAACNEFMHNETRDLRSLEKLANCESLSANWREIFASRLRGTTYTSTPRLFGPFMD